jgi:hypothetical protein
MRKLSLLAGSACVAAICGMGTASSVQAATANRYIVVPGANCQLSIPTTDTKFRPKAIGARNESTTVSNFVICPYVVSPSDGNASPVKSFYVMLYSIDGVARDVTCTAVTGIKTLGVPPVYASKTVTVPGAGAAQVQWMASDFGGTNGDPITASANLSVTCLLPPQTAVDTLVANFDYEIGA